MRIKKIIIGRDRVRVGGKFIDVKVNIQKEKGYSKVLITPLDKNSKTHGKRYKKVSLAAMGFRSNGLVTSMAIEYMRCEIHNYPYRRGDKCKYCP